MVERQWYVARGGETYGPFSSDQMAEGARSGELTRDDLVWFEGMAYWLPAGRVPELWPAPERAPAPAAPPIDRASAVPASIVPASVVPRRSVEASAPAGARRESETNT